MAANSCVPITEYMGTFISRRWIPRTGLLDQRNAGVVETVVVLIITITVTTIINTMTITNTMNDSFDSTGNLLITVDYY